VFSTVYLRTDPEVVYDRICQRGRSEEKSISLNYLKSIHELHEDWLIRKKFFLPAPVSESSWFLSLGSVGVDSGLMMMGMEVVWWLVFLSEHLHYLLSFLPSRRS